MTAPTPLGRSPQTSKHAPHGCQHVSHHRRQRGRSAELAIRYRKSSTFPDKQLRQISEQVRKNWGREMRKTVVAMLTLACIGYVASASAQTETTPAAPAASATPAAQPTEEKMICVDEDAGGNS